MGKNGKGRDAVFTKSLVSSKPLAILQILKLVVPKDNSLSL